jgi:hypothetical protein
MDTMGMDIIGSDYMGDDEIGQLMLRPQSQAAARPRISIPALRGAVTQGVSMPQEELDYLPFAVTQIVTGGPTASQAIAFPQRPFRGERLIATAVATLGAATIDAGGLVSIDPAIYVGAVQVGASQGGAPLSTFGPSSFGVRLSFPVAGQGTRVFIPFVYLGPALGAGDSLVVAFTVIGRACR